MKTRGAEFVARGAWRVACGSGDRPSIPGSSHTRHGPRVTLHEAAASRHAPRATRHSAFTLIELTISAALMALILTAAYACLSSGVASRKLIEPRADILQNARVAMGLLSADLRCACPLPQGTPFLGVRRNLGEVAADNLDFATHNYTPQKPGEGDFCEESIFVERNPKTGAQTLWRRRNPTLALDPLSGGSREEIATGVAGLRLEYYDGIIWYDAWGDPKPDSAKSAAKADSGSTPPNMTGLPEAVRITLYFDSEPRPASSSSSSSTLSSSSSPEIPAAPPLVFQTVARLNLPSTGALDGQSSPGSPSSSGSAPTNPGGGNP